MNKNKNFYWMYSKHAIENALLNPNRKVSELLIEEKLKPHYDNFLKVNKIKKKLKVKIVKKDKIIKKIGRLAKYQGSALLVEKLFYSGKYFSKLALNDESLILIIDQLNDPKNLGGLLRVSYAFGVKTVIILERSMPDENGLIASIASGSLDRINIFKVTNLVNIINYLKKNNWWIIGLESKQLDNCIDIKKKKYVFKNSALIIGSENKGMRALVRKSCDILYRINLKNHDLDSINVVQAASIALYELT